MKRLAALFALLALFSPNLAFAAIAIDSSLGTAVTRVTGTSATKSFTNSSGTELVVCVNDGNITPTSVTYNGTAMTRAVSNTVSGSNNGAHLYYLASPATGTHDIVVSQPSSSDIDIGAASYTGMASTPEVITSATTTSTTLTETLTTVSDNSWMIACGPGIARGISASTNSTLRSGVSGGGEMFDTNGAITPAGSYSMSQTLGGSLAAGQPGVAISFAPAAAPASAVQSIIGLVRAFWIF